MPVYSQSLSFRDVKGKTAWVRSYISAADRGTASGLVASFWLPAFTGASTAGLNNYIGPRPKPPGPPVYGNGSMYKDAEDKLVCHLTTAVGTVHILALPAPYASMFLADGETVNVADARMVALIDAMTARGMCTRDGELLTGFVIGLRGRVVLRRKAGLYVLNPQLTTPNL
jgi:hypothetical protein